MNASRAWCQDGYAQRRIEELERQLAAQKTVNRLLVDRLEECAPSGRGGAIAEPDRSLDLAVVRKTREFQADVASLVSALRDYSHPSTSARELVDIADVVAVAASEARSEWKCVATLDVNIEPSFPAIPCLRKELSRVVLKLVTNAAHSIADVAHATCLGDKGKITISVKRCAQWAEIRVSDTGTHIPCDVRNRDFDPSFRTKSQVRGNGRGLAIAYGYIADGRADQISFATQAEKGSTFLVRLPLGEKSQEPPSCA
jgi:signal transduction histidine kinase